MCRIACDIDGVLADVIRLLRDDILKKCGYDIHGKVDTYEFYKSVPELSRTDWGCIVDNILACQENVTAYEDALKYFPLIYNPDLVLITARRDEFIPETVKWMKRHFDIEPQIVSRSSSAKLPYLLENKFNILIEDRLRTANQSAEYIQVILINRPWNIGRETHQNVIRVQSFREIVKLLCK